MRSTGPTRRVPEQRHMCGIDAPVLSAIGDSLEGPRRDISSRRRTSSRRGKVLASEILLNRLSPFGDRPENGVSLVVHSGGAAPDLMAAARSGRRASRRPLRSDLRGSEGRSPSRDDRATRRTTTQSCRSSSSPAARKAIARNVGRKAVPCSRASGWWAV